MPQGVVLVTGIAGFIATHIALAFLEAGYIVKGTARSTAKVEEWIAHFPVHKHNCQWAIVEDMVVPGAFDEAVKGCDVIAHVASPVIGTDSERDVLIPAISGTKNLLEATKLEPKTRRVVFTSSLATVVDPDAAADHIHTSDDWNSVTYDEAKVSASPVFVYRASKVLAERTF